MGPVTRTDAALGGLGPSIVSMDLALLPGKPAGGDAPATTLGKPAVDDAPAVTLGKPGWDARPQRPWASRDGTHARSDLASLQRKIGIRPFVLPEGLCDSILPREGLP